MKRARAEDVTVCVMVIEDEFLVREMVQEVLEDAGYEVLAAEHALQAFEYMDIYPGRVICLVTDYHLPGRLTGGHVVERMRPLYPSIPMVLATANPHATTPEWRTQYNVEMLAKPYSAEDLVDLVNAMVTS